MAVMIIQGSAEPCCLACRSRGPWVSDFHRWCTSSAGNPLLAFIDRILRHAGQHSGSILLTWKHYKEIQTEYMYIYMHIYIYIYIYIANLVEVLPGRYNYVTLSNLITSCNPNPTLSHFEVYSLRSRLTCKIINRLCCSRLSNQNYFKVTGCHDLRWWNVILCKLTQGLPGLRQTISFCTRDRQRTQACRNKR